MPRNSHGQWAMEQGHRAAGSRQRLAGPMTMHLPAVTFNTYTRLNSWNGAGMPGPVSARLVLGLGPVHGLEFGFGFGFGEGAMA